MPSKQQSQQDGSAQTLSKQYGILTFEELDAKVQKATHTEFIIEGLLPSRSITLILGQSGIGKTPLVYQMGICIAAKTLFLGRNVNEGPVLFVDFENGPGQVRSMVQRLAIHLNLPRVPVNCHFWNINDCAEGWGARYSLENLVKDIRPIFVVIDSMSGWKPDIEKDTEKAITGLQELRRLSRRYGCTFLMIVHPRKAPTKESDLPLALEHADILHHFEKARGAAALINASDVRLAIERPELFDLPQVQGLKQEPALVMRGFRRIEGEIPPVYVSRIIGEDGEPLGYESVTSVALLKNVEQITAFERLPSQFSFKAAKELYGKQDSATRAFLKKAISAGLLRQAARGRYEKSALKG